MKKVVLQGGFNPCSCEERRSQYVANVVNRERNRYDDRQSLMQTMQGISVTQHGLSEARHKKAHLSDLPTFVVPTNQRNTVRIADLEHAGHSGHTVESPCKIPRCFPPLHDV